jgi:hypothetical protein
VPIQDYSIGEKVEVGVGVGVGVGQLHVRRRTSINKNLIRLTQYSIVHVCVISATDPGFLMGGGGDMSGSTMCTCVCMRAKVYVNVNAYGSRAIPTITPVLTHCDIPLQEAGETTQTQIHQLDADNRHLLATRWNKLYEWIHHDK